VLNAVGARNITAARGIATRVGAVGAIAALGFAAAQTETGRRAVQWVDGYWRREPSGQATYVHPHARRVG
jgi:hypothetical protein